MPCAAQDVAMLCGMTVGRPCSAGAREASTRCESSCYAMALGSAPRRALLQRGTEPTPTCSGSTPVVHCPMVGEWMKDVVSQQDNTRPDHENRRDRVSVSSPLDGRGGSPEGRALRRDQRDASRREIGQARPSTSVRSRTSASGADSTSLIRTPTDPRNAPRVEGASVGVAGVQLLHGRRLLGIRRLTTRSWPIQPEPLLAHADVTDARVCFYVEGA